MLLDRGLFAIGELDQRDVLDCRELLVSNLNVGRDLLNGDNEAPLEQWVLVAFDHDESQTPHSLLRRINVKHSQRVVGVMLRDSDTATCQAAVLEDESIRPVDELLVSGPGMLRLASNDDSPVSFDRGGNVRWSRTAGALGEQLVGRLRNMDVTLVGAGRLGSQLAFQLAALGVSTMRLVDGDRLELENLDAMPGLVESDVGRSKAAALAERLCEFRPDMAVSFVDRPVTEPPARGRPA